MEATSRTYVLSHLARLAWRSLLEKQYPVISCKPTSLAQRADCSGAEGGGGSGAGDCSGGEGDGSKGGGGRGGCDGGCSGGRCGGGRSGAAASHAPQDSAHCSAMCRWLQRPLEALALQKSAFGF